VRRKERERKRNEKASKGGTEEKGGEASQFTFLANTPFTR